jgi:hypothetical protein
MGKHESVLRRIQHLVLDICSEPLCTAKIYGSRSLDTICAQIGREVADRYIGNGSIVTAENANSEQVVFVASRLQLSGGHARVIEDLFGLLPHPCKTLLVTEVPAKSDRVLQKKFEKMGVTVIWAPLGGLLKKLIWLQKYLLKSKPSAVYLFNHHEDSVAVASMSMLEGIDRYFYHHSDHHLTLGLHLKGFVHIDIHAFGFHRCREESGIRNNIYFPLVACDLGVQDQPDFMQDGLTTCTAARQNKLGVPYFIHYADVIPALLAGTEGKHIHIGKISWLMRLRLRVNMWKLGVASSRLVYIPWVSSVWEALHKYRVDMFIASFPIVGGKTLVEVMGAGIPLVVHDNPNSRFLGGIDMVYPGAFCWRHPEQLIAHCKLLDPAQLKIQSIEARAHYWHYYRQELLAVAMQKEGGEVPPLHPYISEAAPLLTAMRILAENSPARWIGKFTYRTLKKWRSYFQCYW